MSPVFGEREHHAAVSTSVSKCSRTTLPSGIQCVCRLPSRSWTGSKRRFSAPPGLTGSSIRKTSANRNTVGLRCRRPPYVLWCELWKRALDEEMTMRGKVAIRVSR